MHPNIGVFSPTGARTPAFFVIPDPVLGRHILCVREDRKRTRRRVKPRDLGLLLTLGAMWGSSFLWGSMSQNYKTPELSFRALLTEDGAERLEVARH